MNASNLELLEKSRLPAAQARAILQAMEFELTARDAMLATKADLVATRSDLREQLLETERRLELKIESVRSDLLRWSFAFWVTQLGAVAYLLKLMVR